METIIPFADLSIRRACGFAGLGICSVMLALSFDLGLALRSGGTLAGVLCLSLAVAAWRAPHRDMRRSELWSLLRSAEIERLSAMPRPRAQALLADVLRSRLLWHAERVGLIAVGFWGLAFATMLVHAVLPG